MFIYEGCYPFNQNKETKQWRWHFEDPKKPDHKVIKEKVIEYKGDKVIVVECVSKKFDYYAILGRYDDANNKIRPFHESSATRKGIAENIAKQEGLDGLVDI